MANYRAIGRMKYKQEAMDRIAKREEIALRRELAKDEAEYRKEAAQAESAAKIAAIEAGQKTQAEIDADVAYKQSQTALNQANATNATSYHTNQQAMETQRQAHELEKQKREHDYKNAQQQKIEQQTKRSDFINSLGNGTFVYGVLGDKNIPSRDGENQGKDGGYHTVNLRSYADTLAQKAYEEWERTGENIKKSQEEKDSMYNRISESTKGKMLNSLKSVIGEVQHEMRNDSNMTEEDAREMLKKKAYERLGISKVININAQ